MIILVVLLFLVAADRLLPLRGEAEAAHVASTIGTLRSALGMTAAERIVDHGPSGLPDLAAGNPMNLLATVPDNYIGELESAEVSQVPPGRWYFERDTGRLGYRVRYPQYLEPPSDEAVHLAWQVMLDFRDNDSNAEYNPDIDTVRGIGLRVRHEHAWQNIDMPEAIATDTSP